MERAYVRQIPGRAADAQNKMAREQGITAIYEEKRHKYPEERALAIRSLRPGDMLWVSDLPVLANNREEAAFVLAALVERKVGLIEGSSGRRAQAVFAGQMVLDAIEYWNSRNKTFGKMTAKEAGGIGGTKARRREVKNRMPIHLAREIWKAQSYMNVDERLAKINADAKYEKKWSMSALYARLGPSGGPSGRRTNLKK